MIQHHPMKIGSHDRMKCISVSLQLQQTGDETGDPPGRYRPARCENPNSTVSLLNLNLNLGFSEPVPPGQDKVSSTHHEYFHTSLTPTTRDDNGDLPGRYCPVWCGTPNLTSCLLNPNLGFVGPAPPEEDHTSSPDQKLFHTFTTLAKWGRKRRSPGSIPPRTV